MGKTTLEILNSLIFVSCTVGHFDYYDSRKIRVSSWQILSDDLLTIAHAIVLPIVLGLSYLEYK